MFEVQGDVTLVTILAQHLIFNYLEPIPVMAKDQFLLREYLWNNLPDDLKSTSSLQKLKAHLKLYLHGLTWSIDIISGSKAFCISNVFTAAFCQRLLKNMTMMMMMMMQFESYDD